tara:strand:+ start:225 stop:347 length:123 start_codon:yes stop_codon:yes gene_type:complete
MGVTLWSKPKRDNNKNNNKNLEYKMTKLISLMERLLNKLS